MHKFIFLWIRCYMEIQHLFERNALFVDICAYFCMADHVTATSTIGFEVRTRLDCAIKLVNCIT